MKKYIVFITLSILLISCGKVGNKIGKEIWKKTSKDVTEEVVETSGKKVEKQVGKELSMEAEEEIITKSTKEFFQKNPTIEKILIKLSDIKGSPHFSPEDFIIRKGPNGGDLIIHKTYPRIAIEIKGNVIYAKAGSTKAAGGINDLLNSLLPNKTYIIDDHFIYKTDKYGRVIEAYADRTKATSNGIYRNPTRNSNVQDAVREQGLKTDDGGHIFANSTNGPNEMINQIPMDSKVNRSGGSWRKIEQIEEDAIKAGKQVKSKRRLIYKGDSPRPYQIEVEIDIDGTIIKEIIENVA